MAVADFQIASSKGAPLERNKKLSESLIWKLQRGFYQKHGSDAWSKQGIPCQITSNPHIARAYAEVMAAFLRDLQRAGSIAPGQAVHILELGAGHGRFGFLAIRSLLEIAAAGDLAFRYVLTDFSERNIGRIRNHPKLLPFFASGHADVALLDLERIGEIRLQMSGTTLAAGHGQPLIVVANYVFDSVPQDAFYVQDGVLHESLISIASPQREPELDDPEILSRSEIAFTQNLARADYYADPQWNALLEQTRRRLPSAPFLFPVTALQAIGALEEIAGCGLLLLSADKGLNRDEAILQGQGAPGLTRHASGCFSMMVDYQTIGERFRLRGGTALHPGHSHESINVSAFLSRGGAEDFLATRRAYEEHIERFGPDDCFSLIQGCAGAAAQMSHHQLLSLLRLSGWDPYLAGGLVSVWKSRLSELGEKERREIYQGIKKAWECHFSIGEADDLAFHFGVLTLEFGYYAEAVELLRESAEVYGMEPGTAYNLAVCYLQLRDWGQARLYVEQCLELSPDFDAARALRIRIESVGR